MHQARGVGGESSFNKHKLEKLVKKKEKVRGTQPFLLKRSTQIYIHQADTEIAVVSSK